MYVSTQVGGVLIIEDHVDTFDSLEALSEVILSALQHEVVVFPSGWVSASWFPTLVRVLESSGVTVAVTASDGPSESGESGEPGAQTRSSSDAPEGEQKPAHEEAVELVRGPRGDFYDTPFENFTRTGRIWSGVLHSKLREGAEVTPEDVALCMIGVKMSREAFRHKRDNIVDMHGYLLTLEDVLNERQDREED